MGIHRTLNKQVISKEGLSNLPPEIGVRMILQEAQIVARTNDATQP